jgi:signal recognition particle receptor subunit beta
MTKILGTYGLSDVGKTTLVEKVSQKITPKYEIQRTKGVTLKTSYAQLACEDQVLYFLDHPGHKSLSLETLRNIDLIDLGIYIIDSNVINNALRLKTTTEHLELFTTIFNCLSTPYIVLINKVQQIDLEKLKALFEIVVKMTPYIKGIYATSCFNSISIDFIRQKITETAKTTIEKKLSREGVLLRTIKSFDVNKNQARLTKVIGGILGGYYYNKYDNNKDYVLGSKKQITDIKIIKAKEDKIGTLETTSDPFFFKNDQKKGTFVIEKESYNLYPLLDTKFMINMDHCWKRPIKGQLVHLICEGQIFSGTIKQVDKKKITVIRKDNYTHPLYLPNCFTIMVDLKQGVQETQILCMGRVV